MGDLSASSCDYIELATEGVRGLHPYQPGKPIDELERELGIDNIIKLASNENPQGMSLLAQKAIQDQLSTGARYPDGSGFQLKSSLADYLSLSPDMITLGNGSNDILDLITRAYASTESEVIYSEYAFAVYAISCQSVGAKAVVTPAKNWGHDLDAMCDAITGNTRIIFIANPNNPTGTSVSSKELNVFMNRVPENIIVVLDEAYCEYIDSPDFPDGVAMLRTYSNLIVTRTFSKAWGLASLRVGYALSNPVIANVLNRVRHPFNVNSFALAAANAVLSDQDYLNRSKLINVQGLSVIADGLEGLGLSFIPSCGNFISFDTGLDGMSVFEALLLKGVIVRPLGNYGMPRHLRVTVGLPEENQRFLAALNEVLA